MGQGCAALLFSALDETAKVATCADAARHIPRAVWFEAIEKSSDIWKLPQ